MYNLIVHRIRYGNGTQYGVLCTDCTSVDVTAIGSHNYANNSVRKSYRANYALEPLCNY